MKRMTCLAVVMLAVVDVASADSIRGIDIDFVTIGNAGNPGDTRAEAYPSGSGTVGYDYRIGKYEITAAQWQTINAAAGIGNPGGWSGNQPVAWVSWYDAAQFCNYLTSGDKNLGAYQLSPGVSITVDRAAAMSAYGTIYVLPTEDEWYKAAYFKPDGSGYSSYANGQENIWISPPHEGWNYYGGGYDSPWDVGTGTMEQNGTFDMMGNVWEWNEKLFPFESADRGFRGGSYAIQYYGHLPGWPEDVFLSSADIAGGIQAWREETYVGFRIASVQVGDVTIDATVNIDPDTLNLNSKGKWVTCYIELPEGHEVSDIDVDSVSLEGLLEVQQSDIQDGMLMVKFDREDLAAYLEVVLGVVPPVDVELMVTGNLTDGTPFEGRDTIRVIDKGGGK